MTVLKRPKIILHILRLLANPLLFTDLEGLRPTKTGLEFEMYQDETSRRVLQMKYDFFSVSINCSHTQTHTFVLNILLLYYYT